MDLVLRHGIQPGRLLGSHADGAPPANCRANPGGHAHAGAQPDPHPHAAAGGHALNLPSESDLEAAFKRDWASLIARLDAAPQGSPEIPAGSQVILVPRTARLAYIQSQLWPEMTAGAGGVDAVYVSVRFSRGQVLGYRLNYSMSVSTETLEIITNLELFVEHEGQLRRVATLETTGGEGATSVTELVRNAVAGPGLDPWRSRRGRISN